MLGVEEAEGGHHRHSHGRGKEKGPEGKRRGRPEEGNEHVPPRAERPVALHGHHLAAPEDRKSTRLNSSHSSISYAVFCLKKKKHPLNIPSLQKNTKQKK